MAVLHRFYCNSDGFFEYPQRMFGFIDKKKLFFKLTHSYLQTWSEAEQAGRNLNCQQVFLLTWLIWIGSQDRVYSSTFLSNKSYLSGGMRFPTMVCATSKGSDQPAHTRSLIRAFASCLNIL